MKEKRRLNFIMGIFLALLTLSSAAPVFASNAINPPSTIPLVTQLVALYAGQEKKLQEAVQHTDLKEAQLILANDFEERKGNNPAMPIPRDLWISTSFKHPELVTGVMSQFAAHEVGNLTILSFIYTPTSKTTAKKVFVVDVWKNENNLNKLIVRYSSIASSPDASFYKQEMILKKAS